MYKLGEIKWFFPPPSYTTQTGLISWNHPIALVQNSKINHLMIWHAEKGEWVISPFPLSIITWCVQYVLHTLINNFFLLSTENCYIWYKAKTTCMCFLHRDTAANHESMATVLLSNLLSQLDRQCSQEQNFLQRHNLKFIYQQLQVPQ